MRSGTKAMLNQNIALILSALLGGALTVVGGFAANNAFKTMQDRKEKWRELRNIVEKMYQETNAVKLLYLSVIQHIKAELSLYNVDIDEQKPACHLYRFSSSAA